jgi:hypothetical protein
VFICEQKSSILDTLSLTASVWWLEPLDVQRFPGRPVGHGSALNSLIA